MEDMFEKAALLLTGMDLSMVQGTVPTEVHIQDLPIALLVVRYRSILLLIH